MKRSICLFSLILCLAGISIGCKASRSPVQTVKDFLEYLEKGNSTEAAELFSKAGVSKIGGLDKFKEYISDHSRMVQKDGGIEWVMVKEEKITGDAAEITVVVKFRNNNRGGETSHCLLGKEDGEWKIHIIR